MCAAWSLNTHTIRNSLNIILYPHLFLLVHNNKFSLKYPNYFFENIISYYTLILDISINLIYLDLNTPNTVIRYTIISS